MIQKSIIFLSLIINCLSIEIQDDYCVLQLPKLSFFAPLIYSQDGILLPTEHSTPNLEAIKVSHGQNILLSCSPNYFSKYSSKKSINGICKGGDVLEIDGVEKSFYKDLACELRPIEEIITPVSGCPGNLTSTEFGFTHPIHDKSYVLGEACYNEVEGRTRFVHFLERQHYRNEDIEKVALRIQQQKYFNQKHPMSRYKLDFLKAARMDILNEHLSNVLETESIPTLVQDKLLRDNLLVNQQFHSALKLAWNYIMLPEETANILERLELKFVTDKTIEVYIGTHGTLTIPNKEGAPTKLYLTESDRFPVPQYIWVLIRIDDKAVALAISNNESTNGNSLCNSKCNQIPFREDSVVRKALNSGRIHCCDYTDFRKTVFEMPDLERSFEFSLP